MEKDGIKLMENGLKQIKSTGYTPSGKTKRENEQALTKSTPVELKKSQVLKIAPIKEELKNLEEKALDLRLLEKLLAVQIILGDFKAVKMNFPESWMTSKDGKIYWCLRDSEHLFDIENGNLLADGVSVNLLVEKAMEKITGDEE